MLRRLAVLGSMVLVLAACSSEDAPKAAKPKSVDLTQFIGKKSSKVAEYFRAKHDNYDVDVWPLDYSPAGRMLVGYGWDDEILAVKNDSISAKSTNGKVIVWVLRKGEAKWYREHQTMPKIKKGVDCDDATSAGSPFAAVGEKGLIHRVWDPRKKHPKGDRLKFDTRQREWPYPEAKLERQDFPALEKYDVFSAVSGQYPAAGEPLRMGSSWLSSAYRSSRTRMKAWREFPILAAQAAALTTMTMTSTSPTSSAPRGSASAASRDEYQPVRG